MGIKLIDEIMAPINNLGARPRGDDSQIRLNRGPQYDSPFGSDAARALRNTLRYGAFGEAPAAFGELPSAARMRGERQMSGIGEAAASQAAARRSRMGAGAALETALQMQGRASEQALMQTMEERQREQAISQQGYLGYLNSLAREEATKGQMEAAFNQMRLDAYLAQQQMESRNRGAMFSFLGSLLGGATGLAFGGPAGAAAGAAIGGKAGSAAGGA